MVTPSSRRLSSALLAATVCLLTMPGCGSDLAVPGTPDSGTPDASTPDSGTPDAGMPDAGMLPTTVGGDRPAKVFIPEDYDAAKSYPLVILLHGFGATGAAEDLVFRLGRQVTDKQFLFVLPDGTKNSNGARFWNATDACCAATPAERQVDDVAYLRGLVSEMEAHFSVDAKRVYFVGHSNGGFMSFRMACDASDIVTAIASLAGSTWNDASKCDPEQPVSVLDLHGTADTTVPYDGASAGPVGTGRAGYPSAPDTVKRFTERAGCDVSMPEDGGRLDLDATVAGDETVVTNYTVGCQDGVDASLWTLEGSGHIFATTPQFPVDILDWLFRHSR